MGKVKQIRFNPIGRRSSTRLFALLGKAHSKWWYETDPMEFDPKGFFSFRPDGESRTSSFWTQVDDVRQPGFLPCLEKPTQNGGMKPTSWNSIARVFFRFAPIGKIEKTRFERNWTTFVNPAYALLGKAHSKWWYETDPMEFDPKGFFSFRPDGESRTSSFWTQLDDVRQPGFLPCLEKPTQNGGMKPTSWNSILRVFFRFGPMGKIEKTRFERNWTTFVTPAFCPAWKSPLKMVVWNRPRGIRSQGCFFVSPPLGKSKKRVLSAIWRRSSTRLFGLLGKAHSKWWYETDPEEFDPKGVFSFRPHGENRKNAFWAQYDDVRQPGFLPCLEKPTQNGGMKPTSWNSILRVFFRFAPIGKVEQVRFDRNWTTFVNPAFCPAWKSPLKMVVWNRPHGIRSQGCFFVSPPWGKSKKRVLSAIGRRSSPRLFALLGKAHSKWWYETDLVEFDLKGVFSFRPYGESQTNSFQPNWTTFVNPAFCPAWKSPLKMVVWNRPHGIRSQGFFFVSPRWGKSNKFVLNASGRRSSTRLFALLGKAHSKWWYETHIVEFDRKGVFSFRPDRENRKNAFWAQLDDVRQPGLCPAWKSPLKMVVWNRPHGIRSQGFFFVSPRWGKSNKFVLNAIGRRSSTRLFALLGKAHLKWWYETDLVEFDLKGVFSFRPHGENRKNAFWAQLDDVRHPGFLPCLEKPTQNGGMKPTSWNSILRVFFRFAMMGKVEQVRFERNWTTFVNPAFCPAFKSPLKMVVWNRPHGIRFQGFFSRFAPMGKVQQVRLNPIGRHSSTRLFALLGKAHSKWWYETDLVEFDLKGVFSFCPDGESQTNSFEPNWTTFVTPAFCPAWKSPLKMVVWNRPRGIRS